jgi:hypothetical protein
MGDQVDDEGRPPSGPHEHKEDMGDREDDMEPPPQ